MLLQFEVLRHATLLLQTPTERDATQIPLQVIRPLVIGTRELGSVAEVPAIELHPAMSTAVDNNVNATFFIARNHHRFVANDTALEIAKLRNFCSQSNVTPARPPEDPLLFALVDFWI